MNKCLYCYKPIDEGNFDFHLKCSKKFFGNEIPPILPYTEENLIELAVTIIKSHTTITGVQPKLSLTIDKEGEEYKRLTIVGLWGEYILKPQTELYPELPEVEDLTMHLAEISDIETVPHSLIKMNSGKLAYISKRIDRKKKSKLAMEDMCQLTERLTEEKYNGSYEQIAKIINKFSALPGLDLVNFAEVLIFSYLVGNADMHLKNFSLFNKNKIGMALSPAYDLVATKIVNPDDIEEMALTLNGKKRKINKNDFNTAFLNFGLDEVQIKNIINKFNNLIHKYIDFINISFVSDKYKEKYIELVELRAKVLFD
jgi:serine/threonine-protein kinase HipA